jgi:hypothetical protein
MKTYRQFITEVSADTDIVTIAHAKEYEKASEDQRDAASAAGRIRSRDAKSQIKKKELKQKAQASRERAKKHLETIRKIRKQYKQREKGG